MLKPILFASMHHHWMSFRLLKSFKPAKTCSSSTRRLAEAIFDRIRPPELIHSLLLTEILVAQIAVKAIQGSITLDDDSNASDIKNHQPAAASVILCNGRIDLGSLQGLLFSLS